MVKARIKMGPSYGCRMNGTAQEAWFLRERERAHDILCE
jgi:hypothetical protein